MRFIPADDADPSKGAKIAKLLRIQGTPLFTLGAYGETLAKNKVTIIAIEIASITVLNIPTVCRLLHVRILSYLFDAQQKQCEERIAAVERRAEQEREKAQRQEAYASAKAVLRGVMGDYS